ncbi:MAG TPA: cytochrome c peroxidase [Planctomycetota bacterium]|jgi:cytochrome c peroxidase|nr:cytochrome c peroxidase [Planctomycetota bacterium]
MTLATRSVLAASLVCALAPALRAQGGGLPPPPPPPPGNPITPSKVLLGKALFWDEQLSSNGTVSCATCHVPARGGADPRSNAANARSHAPGPDGILGTLDDVIASNGISRQDSVGSYILDATDRLLPQVTGRNAPAVVNAAYAPLLFWDGRATGTFRDPVSGAVVLQNGAALESQAAAPPVSDVEMAHVGRSWTEVAALVEQATPLRLAPSISPDLQGFVVGRTYPQLFQDAFGTADVTPARILMAIATYERTQFSNQAPIDAFLNGNQNALTPQEQQGRQIFNGIGSCNVCHAGALFSDNQFHYIGVRPQNDDLGRSVVTNNANDRGAFRTPSLRNVELRGAYFHNGGKATLEDVVDFYNRGGDFDAPNKPPAIHPLNLNAGQRAALLAFLRRPMTDPRVAAEAPPFDHPTLYAVSPRVPAHFGSGTAGTGGFTPELVALEPPVLGNDRMAIGIDRALSGKSAVLVVGPQASIAGTPFQGARLFVALKPGVATRRIQTLKGGGAGDGWGSVTWVLPTDPARIGSTWYAQWLVLDGAAGRRFAASDAVEWTIF